MTFGKHETDNCEVAGLSLQLEHFVVERPRWRALLVGGPWEDAAQLAPIAEALQAEGISATLVHLPGCGRVPAPGGLEYGDWVDALVALSERTQSDRCKLAMLGIGLGGTLAYGAAAKGAPVEALWLTAIGDPRRAPLRVRILGGSWPPLLTTLGMQWLSPVIGQRPWLPPGVAARPLLLGNDNVTREPAPLPRHSVRWLSSFLTHQPAIEPEEFRRCPVVLVAPTADRWLQLEPSLDFYRRLPGDKQLHMLQGANHLPTDPPSAATLAQAFKNAHA